jgi:hypothetical protein
MYQEQRTDLTDRKHIFAVLGALKQLCVHPMLLLQGAYQRELQERSMEQA